MTRFLPLLMIVALAGCSREQLIGTAESARIARVDHVIVGTADLERGIAEMERLTGVRATNGGVHPGRGTRNALMSLGDGAYLELLAPDPAQSVDNEELRELRALAKLTPVGWAVSSDEEAGLRTRLAAAGFALSTADAGSRRKPDGSVLHWVTFGYEKLEHPLAPFFILWANPDLHPSRTSPGGCVVEQVTLHDQQPDLLRRAIAPLGLPATVAYAQSQRLQFQLSCPTGRINL